MALVVLIAAGCGSGSDDVEAGADPDRAGSAGAPADDAGAPADDAGAPADDEDSAEAEAEIPEVDDEPDPADGLDMPPALTVTTAEGESVTLDAFTYCWTSGDEGECADGAPEEPLPLLTTDQPLIIDYDLVDWRISTSSLGAEPLPGGAPVKPMDVGRWELTLNGPPGRWELMLFTRGEQGDGAYGLAVETGS